jgi:hypothetical protein
VSMPLVAALTSLNVSSVTPRMSAPQDIASPFGPQT